MTRRQHLAHAAEALEASTRHAERAADLALQQRHGLATQSMELALARAKEAAEHVQGAIEAPALELVQGRESA